MASFVLDASLALKWFLEDEEDRAGSIAVLKSISDRNRPLVPWLWWYEVGNGLTMALRRKRIVVEQVESFLELLGAMPIATDTPSRAIALALPGLARRHNLTAYDAAYLEVAFRTRLPLATTDKALVRAASELGLNLILQG
jgi:predicted nucleic acid-binding protein